MQQPQHDLTLATRHPTVARGQCAISALSRREAESVVHLNAAHASVIEALVWEFHQVDGSGARLAAIDREGLLIDSSGKLVHIAFDAVCPDADDVGQALLRLLKNVSWLEPQSQSVDRRMM